MKDSFLETFTRLYGSAPEFVAVAPGRINLIGEHIDYLDGKVMPIAINRSITVLVRCTGEAQCEVWSASNPDADPQSIDLNDLSIRTAPNEGWLNYIIGVLAVYRDAGCKLSGFQAAVFSDLPSGAGLSSSAALETATALIVEELSGENKTPLERARLCQKAEHEYANVPCGIMDQFSVAASSEGSALMIDCLDDSTTCVSIPEGISILTADTGVKHSLGDGEYRKRREQCDHACEILECDSFRNISIEQVEEAKEALGDLLYRRSRHAVTEMTRVDDFASALTSADYDALGAIMKQGHESLRDDYEVSCDELDALVEAAYAYEGEGMLGSRMTGGGFGGSTVTLIRDENVEEFKAYLEKAYQEKFSKELKSFVTQAVNGAHLEKINEHII